jgi:hypothetical protein
LWVGLGLDFYQVHYYDWMDFTFPGSGLTPVNMIRDNDGVPLDRPCFVGEFGTAVLTSYGLNDTAVFSARWYLDAIRARGYVGAIAWSLNAGDDASDWTSFQPVFTNWVTLARPPVSASDNFNRADGSLGSNWIDSSDFTGGTMGIVSNQVVNSGAVWRVAYWDAYVGNFANDQFSQVTKTASGLCGVVVRHQCGVNTHSSGYLLASDGSLYSFDGIVLTLLASGSMPSTVGTVYKLEIIGSTLNGYANGTLAVTVTDTTYTVGQPGIAIHDGAVDDFAAGVI